jgi:hypothetical protein
MEKELEVNNLKLSPKEQETLRLKVESLRRNSKDKSGICLLTKFPISLNCRGFFGTGKMSGT